MLELYIIRHGQAGTPLMDPMKDDARALTKDGKKKMKSIAKTLKELKISFTIVLTSPLLRAKQTAEILNDFCGSGKELQITDLLKPGSTFDALIKFLNGLKDTKKVAIVGHEPFLSGFASYCLAKTKNGFVHFTKGGIMMIEIGGGLKPGNCLLSWLIEPELLIQDKRDA